MDVHVYRDFDHYADGRTASSTRDETLTDQERATMRSRSEVREEIREGDRQTLRETRREETRIREDSRLDRDRDFTHDGPSGDLIYSGSLKHKEAIHISGPSMIRVTYDIGGVHGERHAACNGGPIMIP